MNDGVTSGKEYDHPTYGKIEIGGFTRNGAGSRLVPAEEECHRNMSFTLYHARRCPGLRGVSVEPAGRTLQGVDRARNEG